MGRSHGAFAAERARGERLEAITREFVRQIVSALRNASFADVAQLAGRQLPSRVRRRRRVSASPAAATPARACRRAPRSSGKASRQTADRRAELGGAGAEGARRGAGSLGVRALSSELGVAADLLAVPLKELRDAGRVAKHGDKRATTYSLP